MVGLSLMESLWFWIAFLFGLFLSGLCVHSPSQTPQMHHGQHVSFHAPQPLGQSSTQDEVKQWGRPHDEEQEQVNTVRVTCHPDSLEILIRADLFAVGAPVDSHELQLGVEPKGFCRAAPSSEDEYRIHVGLDDCGTKHWVTCVFLFLFLCLTQVSNRICP